MSEAESLSQLDVCIVFYIHLSGIRVSQARLRACLNSKLVLCFTCNERHQGTIGEAHRLSQLNVCIVFHTHLSDIRVSQVRPGDFLASMFVLRFTRIVSMSG